MEASPKRCEYKIETVIWGLGERLIWDPDRARVRLGTGGDGSRMCMFFFLTTSSKSEKNKHLKNLT